MWLIIICLFNAALAQGERKNSTLEDHKGNNAVFSHESVGQVSTSLPRLDNKNYREQGRVVDLDEGLQVYIVGNGSKCMIWNYDIYGFDAGRTRQLCDYIANQGYMVILPDYFRGTFHDPVTEGAVEFLIEKSNWTNLKRDWTIVKEFAEEKGATDFGAIGTCWGSYPVVKLSTLPEIKVGISMHPSHSTLMILLEEDEEEFYYHIVGQQLFMPAVSDSPNVKLGGIAESVLNQQLTIIEFNEMQHGWVTRGNMSDPAVERDVNKAMQEAVNFIKRHL